MRNEAQSHNTRSAFLLNSIFGGLLLSSLRICRVKNRLKRVTSLVEGENTRQISHLKRMQKRNGAELGKCDLKI